MGIKKFFKKVGGWVKDKFHKAKNVVTKFAKPVVKVAKKVVNFIDKTPLAPIINGFTGGLFDKGRKLLNLLPDGDVKKKAEEFTNKAEEAVKHGTDKVNEYQDKARGLIDRGRGVLGKIDEARHVFSGSGKFLKPITGIRSQFGDLTNKNVLQPGPSPFDKSNRLLDMVNNPKPASSTYVKHGTGLIPPTPEQRAKFNEFLRNRFKK